MDIFSFLMGILSSFGVLFLLTFIFVLIGMAKDSNEVDKH